MTRSWIEGAKVQRELMSIGLAILVVSGLFAAGLREIAAWGVLLTLAYILLQKSVRTWLWQRLQRFPSWLRDVWQDKALRAHLIPIVLLSLGGSFLLLGAPGFALLQGHHYIANLLFGAKTLTLPSGDQAWPAAILMNLVWPWGFLVAFLLLRWSKVSGLATVIKSLVYGTFVLVWGFGLAWWLCV